MAEQKIQLRKLRDFGENFNDTFLFLRQNLKPLLKSFFSISAIFMVGSAIFLGIYQSRTFTYLGTVMRGGPDSDDFFNKVVSVEFIMLMIFMMLTFNTMQVVLGAYIKSYLEHDGRRPEIDEVWTLFKRYFFRIFFYSIPIYVVIVIGTLLCFAPGIYLWVLFTPFPLVVMIEDRDLRGTYERCLELIKDNFWISFAIYVVAYLIFYISYGIISQASQLILGVTAYFSSGDLTAAVSMVTSFLTIFSLCFYIIFFISVALQYFNLVEKHDGTGLMSRINSIGTGKTDINNTEEHY